jgi:quercetin 2,3-dioxygenase
LNILEKRTRFILLAGKPLNEPIAYGGPFVLNEEWEVKKAYDDFKYSKNGFESTKNWKAENQKMKIRGKSV